MEAATQSRALGTGTLFGRFVVLQPVGAGSTATVYAAHDTELKQRVAIKVLHPRSDEDDHDDQGCGDAWGPVIASAERVASIDHPNVIRIHDVGLVDDRAFVAMELIEGSDLGWFLDAQQRRCPRLHWSQRVEKLLLAGEGLAAAHDAGIVHGDFKPANVLVGREGQVKVTDFGISIAAGLEPETLPSAIVNTGHDNPSTDGTTLEGLVLWGTPQYMAPELFDGDRPSEASDIYSFCTSLYQALWGRLPAESESLIGLLGAKLEPATAPSSDGVPRGLRRIIVRGLDPSPRVRPHSMRALLGQIQSVRRAPRRLAIIGAGAATACALIAVGLFASGNSSCDRGENAFASSWNADARQNLAERLLAPAAVESARALDALDAYAAAWTASHRENCSATQHDDQPESTKARVAACLDLRQAEHDAWLEGLSHAPRGTLLPSQVDPRQLRPATDCTELASAVQAPHRVDDSISHAFNLRLARARGLSLAGLNDDAATLASTVEREANRDGAVTVQASAHVELGRIESARAHPHRAAFHLKQAVWLASSIPAPALAAEAAVVLLDQILGDPNRSEEVAAWLPHAEAAVEKVSESVSTTQASHAKRTLARARAATASY